MQIKTYIKGTSCISPQNTFRAEGFLNELHTQECNHMSSIEPSYKEFFSAGMARRMGRAIKMGAAAAMDCLQDANIQMPDAILTGTGLGCVQDTEKFLSAILKDKEQFLTPTSFIQSTHNTIGGQIALMLKCNNYNFAYVQSGFSFENCLVDAMMLLNEGEGAHVLVGGIDEITTKALEVQNRSGYQREDKVNNLEVLNHKTRGSINGEGAAFFTLSSENSSSNYACLEDVHTFYGNTEATKVADQITKFLQHHQIGIDEIDAVLLGNNGDEEGDAIYEYLQNGLFSSTVQVPFKPLAGEGYTVNGFALWLASNMLKKQQIPDGLAVRNQQSGELKNVLIYNHFRNTNHSIYWLSKC